jgi:DNA ligase (NAD+)
MDFLAEIDEGRVRELEKRIQTARDAYYNNQPVIPDDEYDALVDELQELHADSPAVTTVGAAVPAQSAWQKVAHTIPMGSLAKVQTVEEMTQWVRSHSRDLKDQPIPYEELLLSDKLDGISLSLTYEDGRFIQGKTRGDGEVGEDITVNVARMQGVPKSIEAQGLVEVRAEIVVHRQDLERHFPGQVSTRNTASGTAKRLDGQGCEHLNVYCYRVEESPVEFEKHSDQFEWLEAQGFQIPRWYVVLMAPGVKTPQDLWVEYQQTTRDELPYDIDGLVVSLNDFSYQLSLGSTNGRPNGEVAFKFAPITRETPSVGIECQVGSTGRITPIAVVRPVRLLGAEIQRASLYNWDYIRKIGYYVGAKVLITRSNDVIPRVVSVTSRPQETSPPPDVCPECGTETEWDGKYLICPNAAECPAQLEGRIKLWIKKLNILEWGDVLIEKVCSEGLVGSVPDLYRLKQAQLSKLERMGPSSAKKAHDQLWSVVPVDLADLVGSLGIPLCGRSTMAEVVGAGFDTIEKLKAVTLTQLQDIPGVGPRRAKALKGWLDRSGSLLDELLDVGVEVKARSVGTLTGKSLCFTGKMKNKRPVLEKMASAAGGQVKGGVGKGLTYLVIADPNSTSKKAEAARKNGTTCISEDDFLAMVGG